MITPAIKEFCDGLAPNNQIIIVPVVTESPAPKNECFPNVRLIVDKHGGESVAGWIIWQWRNIMLEAEAHAVWKTPTGELLDITPHDGEDKIFFLPDDKVVYNGVRIPNHRLALTNSPLTKEYIKLGEMRDKILCSVKGKEVSLPVDLLNRMSELSALFNTEVPRNSPCPCGSGMKYKKCCGFFS